ncbi:MAG: HD domain-containing protein [Acholeplasmatales bacterium]|nr:HD domain-containing protein [Acholeplasmatales bacterium]
MNQEFNPDALTSIKLLNSHGYSAFLVGGSIRDYFLNCDCVDYDVTTNANLEEICEVFDEYSHSIYANRQCVGVKVGNTHIEVSSFKGNSIEDDLYNRDFSINSIAYNPNLGFIDPYKGIEDIKNRLLRTINNPIDVIKKDPIRILRAIRFETLYDLKVDDELEKVIFEYKDLLNLVHPMRFQHEIDPIFLSDKCAFYIKKYKEVFKVLFKPLVECDGFLQHSKWHIYDVFNHIMKVLESTDSDLVLRLSAFFHDIKKPECFKPDQDGEGHFPNHYLKSAEYAKEILEYYAYSHKIVERVYHLVLYHETRLKPDDEMILEFLVQFGKNDIDLFFKLQRADILGQNPELLYRLDNYKLIEERILYFIRNYNLVTYDRLAIKMNDLINEGYSMKTAKKKLISFAIKVTKGEITNDRIELLKLIKHL